MRDPINPADIRVGDRVERVEQYDAEDEFVRRFRVVSITNGTIFGPGSVRWIASANPNAEWFLLDRPDPLAEVVEVVAKAQWVADFRQPEWPGCGDQVTDAYRDDARAVLAAISERWELVERGKS